MGSDSIDNTLIPVEDIIMPLVGPPSSDILLTDMVFGLSKGIAAFYDFCEKKKGIKLNQHNQGRYYTSIQDKADKMKVVQSRKLLSGGETLGVTQDGIEKNKQYMNSLKNGNIPKKYVDTILDKEMKSGIGKADEKYEDNQKYFRRKCKSILYWQLIEKHLRVHFILTRIDMNAVPQKKNKIFKDEATSSEIETKDVGITDAELRWVFRNRTNFFVQLRVQFWITPSNEEGKFGDPVPCIPPWEMDQYKEAWCKYDLEVKNKRATETEEVIDICDSIISECNEIINYGRNK